MKEECENPSQSPEEIAKKVKKEYEEKEKAIETNDPYTEVVEKLSPKVLAKE